MEKTQVLEGNTSQASKQASGRDNSTLKGQAMKKSVKSSMKSSMKSQSDNSPSIEELRALLATLESERERAQASERERASESESEASGKAPRTYEFAAIGAEFDKSHIGAVPTSERAKEYYTRQAALCMRVLAACNSPIASEIQVGKMKIGDIISLCDTWEISPMAMRVVLQLAYPIVTVCCADTEKLARDVYNIARANSLMGSRHNTSMYTKAKDKSCALPFRRVAHNLAALGLDFAPCDDVNDCDFCDNKKSFKELVALCDHWLGTCERAKRASKASEKASEKASKKASKASKASEASEANEASKASKASDSDILSKLRALLGM